LSFYDGETYQLGPVYANSQPAIDFLKSNLPENCTSVRGGNWEGAKLLKFEDGDRFIGPYLDMGSNLTESGKYLIVDYWGDIEHGHEGYYGNNGPCCDHCEEHNGETEYVESVGYHVCEGCRDYDFFVSDYDGEYYRDTDCVEVHINQYRAERWTESQANCYAIYSDDFGEWLKDDVAKETSTGEYIPIWWIGKDWFICSEDGLAYPEDEIIEHDGKFYAKENAPEDSEYYRFNSTEDMIEGKVA
jgi:hypothetical protein